MVISSVAGLAHHLDAGVSLCIAAKERRGFLDNFIIWTIGRGGKIGIKACPHNFFLY
jgi:hypothetical protein